MVMVTLIVAGPSERVKVLMPRFELPWPPSRHSVVSDGLSLLFTDLTTSTVPVPLLAAAGEASATVTSAAPVSPAPASLNNLRRDKSGVSTRPASTSKAIV